MSEGGSKAARGFSESKRHQRCAAVTNLAAVATRRLAEVGVVALHRLALHEGSERLLDRVVAGHLQLEVKESLLALAPVRAWGSCAGTWASTGSSGGAARARTRPRPRHQTRNW